ncbi:MAG: N-(5'-phosphoribosyl)anthranilate isomerase, partial [Kofleriaceae bacterium]|nr:N-(5'-phosphoribosyl)anthranilate isomerase [Kofleriaceae bacterium]
GRGGSGTRFDWGLAAAAVAAGHRVVLAGGLTPDNVAAAIARVRPFAVDVASGVESAPGVKDLDRVRAFLAATAA